MDGEIQPPVVVNVVAGFLGVGKTTAINHLLRSKPEGQRWAVLVNEFGEIGIDGAILAENEHPNGITVKELAGGCICCSAGVMFQVSLALLLQNYRPDRLLIEPTGLATVSGILAILNEPGIAETIETRSILTLTDPAHWADPRYRTHPVWGDQIDAADILVATRCDLSDAMTYRAFLDEVEGVFPPKQAVLKADHGRLDQAWLDEVRPHTHPSGEEHHPDRKILHSHGHPASSRHPSSSAPTSDADHPSNVVYRGYEGGEAQTHGWVIAPDQLILHQRFDQWLAELKTRNDCLRIKAVVRTERGWWLHNITPAQHEKRKTSVHRDSRIELIFSPGRVSPREQLEAQLLQCLPGKHLR